MDWQVLKQTEEHRRRALENAARNLVVWLIKVRKIKAIYHTLNLFNLDVTNKCLIGECWLPVEDLESAQNALTRGTVRLPLLPMHLLYSSRTILSVFNSVNHNIKVQVQPAICAETSRHNSLDVSSITACTGEERRLGAFDREPRGHA